MIFWTRVLYSLKIASCVCSTMSPNVWNGNLLNCSTTLGPLYLLSPSLMTYRHTVLRLGECLAFTLKILCWCWPIVWMHQLPPRTLWPFSPVLSSPSLLPTQGPFRYKPQTIPILPNMLSTHLLRSPYQVWHCTLNLHYPHNSRDMGIGSPQYNSVMPWHWDPWNSGDVGDPISKYPIYKQHHYLT